MDESLTLSLLDPEDEDPLDDIEGEIDEESDDETDRDNADYFHDVMNRDD